MTRNVYTAKARVTGGRSEGRGRTSDGALDVALRLPAELGGEGGGTNPEQLVAVGWAACFESALGAVARRRRREVGEVAIDASVSLVAAADRRYELAVALAVELPEVEDPAEAADLVREAHRVCPYSNATRGNVPVALSANGRPVDGAGRIAA